LKYKNQQREFEYQISRHYDGLEASVLTIDQCQGQEADAVILSFVQKPTRFMTINRLNVALSRTCKKLYVLTDFEDFRGACRDKNWECAGLATDMISDFTSPMIESFDC
jgi:superfamily I DNA and/or RNA helicase